MAKRTKKPPPDLTSTILAPASTGRVKAVFGNTDECCHRWAANTQRDGRAGNVLFADGVIYSSSHFPMTRHVRLPDGRQVIFLTTRKYSSSTSSHLNDVLSVIHGRDVIRCHDVTADWEHAHRENLLAFRTEMRHYAEMAMTARKHKVNCLASALLCVKEESAYAAAVGLGKPRDHEYGGLTRTVFDELKTGEFNALLVLADRFDDDDITEFAKYLRAIAGKSLQQGAARVDKG